jgi:hypothetical protein
LLRSRKSGTRIAQAAVCFGGAALGEEKTRKRRGMARTTKLLDEQIRSVGSFVQETIRGLSQKDSVKLSSDVCAFLLSKVGKCPRCGTIFLKKYRQKYCSLGCTAYGRRLKEHSESRQAMRKHMAMQQAVSKEADGE